MEEIAITDRVAVFIDNGYLAKILKNEFNEAKINYELFSDTICEGCERFRTYFYDCPPFQSEPPTLEERGRKSNADKFHHALKNYRRFEVRLGRLQRMGNPPCFTQKGVDVLLSVDLVRLAWSGKITKAIIVTGDSDFIPAIKDVKDAGVIVELWHGQNMGPTKELFQICDERHKIVKDIIDKSQMS